MKIYDETLTTELTAPDLDAGHLVDGRRLVAHHDAVAQTVRLVVMADSVTPDRPEGLRHEVVDTPAAPAWDEWEDVQVYVPYTEDELAEIAAKKAEDAARAEAEEQARKDAEAEAQKAAEEQAAREEKIARIDAIEAQTVYTAMMTDTLMSEEE